MRPMQPRPNGADRLTNHFGDFLVRNLFDIGQSYKQPLLGRQAIHCALKILAKRPVHHFVLGIRTIIRHLEKQVFITNSMVRGASNDTGLIRRRRLLSKSKKSLVTMRNIQFSKGRSPS